MGLKTDKRCEKKESDGAARTQQRTTPGGTDVTTIQIRQC
jgi:hypothetical protein